MLGFWFWCTLCCVSTFFFVVRSFCSYSYFSLIFISVYVDLSNIKIRRAPRTQRAQTNRMNKSIFTLTFHLNIDYRMANTLFSLIFKKLHITSENIKISSQYRKPLNMYLCYWASLVFFFSIYWYKTVKTEKRHRWEDEWKKIYVPNAYTSIELDGCIKTKTKMDL